MSRLRAIRILIGVAFALFLPLGRSQVLDETWTLSVGGQVVKVNPDGSFLIPNISAPDQFGPGGPGTAPDFRSDRPVRVVGFSTATGVTRYVFSEPFQLSARETVVISNLTLTYNPPPFPESLRAIPDQPTLTAPGQTTQVRVTGFLIDGTRLDLTAPNLGTTYRSSNTNIATVNTNGIVTAAGAGRVFVTAVNEGAASVTEVDVAPGAQLTTISGYVNDANGNPMPGIVVSILGAAGTAVTGPDGRFTITGVNTESPIQGLLARGVQGDTFVGATLGLNPVPNGLTDAGIIQVQPCASLGINCQDTDGDGLPDTVETALGLSPTLADSDRDNIPDGEEDNDGDGLRNIIEFVLRTNPGRVDTDGDGLSDGAEVLEFAANPTRADSDGDGLPDGEERTRGTNLIARDSDGDSWNDEAEVTGGSNPLDTDSRPKLFVRSAPVVGLSLNQLARDGVSRFGAVTATPSVRIGLPGTLSGGDGTQGFRANVIWAYPTVGVFLPAYQGELAHPTVIANPRLGIGLAGAGGAMKSIHVSSPPVKIGISNQ
jgi:hypothetical protein